MNTTRQLARLLEQRRLALEQLRSVCRKQLQALEDADTSRLLRLLVAKQKVITTLQSVEKELDPFRTEDPDQRRWDDLELRDRCRDDLEQADRLWAEIMSVESACEEKLQQRRTETAERLATVGRVTEARTAYLGCSGPSLNRLDLQCE